MRIASAGHAVFSAALIGVGVLFVVKGDVGAIWDGVPKSVPAHAVLAGLCTAVSLACGIGLFWRLLAPPAARTLLVYLLLWMLAFKLPYIVRAPLSTGSYENWAETAVVVAGAWVLYAWFAGDADRKWLGFATGDRGVRIARVLYGLAMIAFGVAHFAYPDLTAPLVPAWLPWHLAWAYFFGCTYICAGIGILGGVYARLAAVLSTLQMGLFTVLVWLPVVATGTGNAEQWSEFAVSTVLTAAGWVVADSWRGSPWFVRGGRFDRPVAERLAKSRA